MLRSTSGEPRELHTAARDVTERREAEQQLNSYAKQLRALSIRDELTGLYNRRGFHEVAAQAHSRAVRDLRPAALIFLDLNGMKRINDDLGHDVGDQALVDTADVLRSALREADVLARLGGDEFVVFALDFGPFDLDPLRSRLRELADARVATHARPFRLSMSVGAAFVEPATPSTSRSCSSAPTPPCTSKRTPDAPQAACQCHLLRRTDRAPVDLIVLLGPGRRDCALKCALLTS